MIAETVWLTAPRKIELRREELAAPAPDELLCESLVSAISPGTELAAYTGQPPLRPGVGYPRLQGYCNVARVLESEAQGFEAGDRILSFASHRTHFVLPANEVLYKLPLDADAGAIACTYLFHLGYNAVLRSEVKPGSRVLVIGLGVLGLTSVALAALAGAEVYALSDQPVPASLATDFGAAATYARSEEELLKNVLSRGADVVISTVNGWDDWQAALRLAGQFSRIACLGFPGRGQGAPERNPLDSQYFYTKQLRIEAVGMSPEHPDNRGFLRFNERANIAWLAELIEAERLDGRRLVSGTYDGRDIASAYDDLLIRKNSPMTYLLRWAE